MRIVSSVMVDVLNISDIQKWFGDGLQIVYHLTLVGNQHAGEFLQKIV